MFQTLKVVIWKLNMASLFDAVERPRVIINTNDFNKPKSLADAIEKPIAEVPSDGVPEHHTSRLQSVMDKLFGLHGQERYQLWPERLVRDAVSAPHDVMTGQIPTHEVDPVTGEVHTSSGLIKAAQDVSALAGTGGLAGTGNEAGMALGVVPVDVAKKLNFKNNPASDVLKQAVGNTPSAAIDADGHLVLKVLRSQLPEQEGAESVRGGVFYLPEGSKYARFYNGTTNNNYGGRQAIEGETAFVNPLLVKGQTGGKAPENAYTQITGDKKAFKNLENDVMEVVNASWMKRKDPQSYYDLVNQFLDKHAPEMRDYADHILDNSNKGNQLRYALQEAAIASAARKAGHDGIIGYSEGRGPNKGKPFLSEIFDVRENRYPSPDGDFSVHPSLYSDSSKPGIALKVMENTNKPFYSAVENALTAAKQPKADAQQWLSFLKNQPGVKQEELAHLGLDKLSGSITKDDLLKAVQEGQPQIKEVIKGTEKGPFGNAAYDAANNLSHELHRKYGNGWRLKASKEELDRLDDLEARGEMKNPNPTKYQDYQLPGGENYREMLLTLPSKKVTDITPEQFRAGAVRMYGEKYADSLSPAQQEIVRRNLRGEHDGTTANDYRSAHWDEPNILAHIRMNDRMIDGKKSLHLEEVQSDWHQDGRKKGYKQDNKNKLSIKNEGGIWRVRDENGERVDLNGASGFTTEDGARNAIANNTRDIGGVPDAPFKKTWDELALKKAITEAVKNGYDSISWTPGEAQVARYDLSKQVDSIKYLKNDDGTYNLVPFKDGKPVHSVEGENIKPDKLADIVGKEVAEKIVNGHGDREKGASDIRVLSGQDLKVGGQGMKAFYDKMLVDKMNALVKKHGGKVEKAEIAKAKPYVDQFGKTKYDPMDVHVLKITPELREHVLKKGFPLFSAGVPVFNPVDHNPFEEKK